MRALVFAAALIAGPLGAHAASYSVSRTVNQSVNEDGSNSPKIVTFAGFTTSLGTLNSVDLSVTATEGATGMIFGNTIPNGKVIDSSYHPCYSVSAYHRSLHRL